VSAGNDQIDGNAGEVGIPVDAVCTGCLSETGQRRVRIKRASMDELGVDDLNHAEGQIFRHVCHRCQSVEFWNVVSVLCGLMRTDGGEAV
jgi:hypothetical protein